jgi:hypothetical protein
MRILGDIEVNIARDQRHNDNQIEAFRSQLLQNYPEISGLL